MFAWSSTRLVGEFNANAVVTEPSPAVEADSQREVDKSNVISFLGS